MGVSTDGRGYSCPRFVFAGIPARMALMKEAYIFLINPLLVISMPQHFKVYDGSYPHFITSATIHWLPIFRRDDYYRILVDSFNYCVVNKGLLVHAYALMPDHFHLISTQVDGKLSQVIGNMKGFTAHQIVSIVKRDGRQDWILSMERAGGNSNALKVWQDGFHPEQVHSKQFFKQKLRYLHGNPVRAGFVENPSDWKYSSAGFYYNDKESVIPISVLEWPD